MKNNKFIKTIFTLILLSAVLALQAQVTMGDETDPESFSILEIISGGKGGLRLPQLDNGERQKVEDSQVFKDEIILKGRGLMIYNTDTDCVEYWNKEKWISLCDNSKPEPPCVEITGVTIKGETGYVLGETISLEVDAFTPSEATAPTTYQWYKDATPLTDDGRISGATSSKLTITSAVAGDAGSYSLKVSNKCSSDIESTAAEVTVCVPITGVTIKGTTAYVLGETISLEVDAITPIDATAPITYQWYKGSTALANSGRISGADGSKLTITSVMATDTGSYSLKVSNGCCNNISSTAANVSVLAFSPNYNVNSGTTTLNVSGIFISGTGDTKTRGTGVNHSRISAGVFRYTNGGGQSYSGLNYTHTSGIKVTIPATTLAVGSGQLAVNVEGTPSTSYAGKAFDIPVTITLSGVNYQLYVRVNVGCGAYTSSSRAVPSVNGDPNWKQFQCFNLGVTSTANPLTPAANIHGAKYRWGVKEVILTQAQDQTYPDAHPIGDWYTTGPIASNEVVNWNMSTANPCLAGWRVPTQAEWRDVSRTASNAISRVGNFTTSRTNYSSGLNIGQALFLPTAGYRTSNKGPLSSRGSHGNYWSTAVYTEYKEISFYFSETTTSYTELSDRANASSVRCISE